MNEAPDFAGIYRTESRAVLATLIRLLGGFDLAEEALHDAWIAALAQWQREGVPKNPRSWLVSTGRFKAIDKLRRKARFAIAEPQLILEGELAAEPEPAEDDPSIADDQLRLIFVCCHPALAPDAQIALTLREVAGLTTEEIAAAYFTSAPTIAQRIVRAKAKIRDAKIPYEVPARADLPDRLDTVLHVLYLIFNAGYSAASGEMAVRTDLCAEAIRLARLLAGLIALPEIDGLLALMLLNDARRHARADANGDIVPLDEQDRSRWDQGQIAEGLDIVRHLLGQRGLGFYALQAAIAAEHDRAPTSASTNWGQIVVYYDLLLRLEPSPVIALNRAVAVGLMGQLHVGLAQLDAILAGGELDDYHLLHAARADFLGRLDRPAEARVAYERALDLARQEPEIRLLRKKLAALGPLVR